MNILIFFCMTYCFRDTESVRIRLLYAMCMYCDDFSCLYIYK